MYTAKVSIFTFCTPGKGEALNTMSELDGNPIAKVGPAEAGTSLFLRR